MKWYKNHLFNPFTKSKDNSKSFHKLYEYIKNDVKSLENKKYIEKLKKIPKEIFNNSSIFFIDFIESDLIDDRTFNNEFFTYRTKILNKLIYFYEICIFELCNFIKKYEKKLTIEELKQLNKMDLNLSLSIKSRDKNKDKDRNKKDKNNNKDRDKNREKKHRNKNRDKNREKKHRNKNRERNKDKKDIYKNREKKHRNKNRERNKKDRNKKKSKKKVKDKTQKNTNQYVTINTGY